MDADLSVVVNEYGAYLKVYVVKPIDEAEESVTAGSKPNGKKES